VIEKLMAKVTESKVAAKKIERLKEALFGECVPFSSYAEILLNAFVPKALRAWRWFGYTLTPHGYQKSLADELKLHTFM
jgi:hypothetical protein